MSNIQYPPDLPECKCGNFSHSGKHAFSSHQKKLYAVCDNCFGVVATEEIFKKLRSDAEARRLKAMKPKS